MYFIGRSFQDLLKPLLEWCPQEVLKSFVKKSNLPDIEAQLQPGIGGVEYDTLQIGTKEVQVYDMIPNACRIHVNVLMNDEKYLLVGIWGD